MENGKKIMRFIVATNTFASQPPEPRPTGAPTASANKDLRTLSWTQMIEKMFSEDTQLGGKEGIKA